MLIFLLMAFAVASVPVRAAEAAEAWHERTAMLLIAEHCQALGALEKAALLSGQGQARGALLRTGKTPQDLATTQQNLALRAQNVSCGDAAVRHEIKRMKDAAQIWSHLLAMRFPARWQSWVARRDDARDKARWRVRILLREKSGAPLDFGLVARGEAHYLALLVPAKPVPSSVVLLMRDPHKLAVPLGPEVIQLMGRHGGTPASLMPPQSVLHSFFAAQKMVAPDSLLGRAGEHKTSASAVLFRFSRRTLGAFAALDPRDVAALELIYPARASKPAWRQRVYLEAADFNAARLFAQTGSGDASVTSRPKATPTQTAQEQAQPPRPLHGGFWR